MVDHLYIKYSKMGNIKAIAEELIALSSEEVKQLAVVLKEEYGTESNHIDLTLKDEDNMTFGQAIKALEEGYCIQRKGWNGKGMFICKQIPAKIEGLIIDKIQSLPQSCKDLLKEREGIPHIDYTNQMLIVNPNGRADSWVASSSDTFATDWQIVK